MQRSDQPVVQAHHAVFSVTALSSRFPVPPEIPADALWVLIVGQGVAIRDGDTPEIYAQAAPPPYARSGPVEYLGHRGHRPLLRSGPP